MTTKAGVMEIFYQSIIEAVGFSLIHSVKIKVIKGR